MDGDSTPIRAVVQRMGKCYRVAAEFLREDVSREQQILG
jgi:hypothetical protein